MYFFIEGLLTTTNENRETTTIVSRVLTDDGNKLDIINIDDEFITIEVYFNGTDETAKNIHNYDNIYDVFDSNNKDLYSSY